MEGQFLAAAHRFFFVARMPTVPCFNIGMINEWCFPEWTSCVRQCGKCDELYIWMLTNRRSDDTAASLPPCHARPFSIFAHRIVLYYVLTPECPQFPASTWNHAGGPHELSIQITTSMISSVINSFQVTQLSKCKRDISSLRNEGLCL